jgi:hypothetical protein
MRSIYKLIAAFIIYRFYSIISIGRDGPGTLLATIINGDSDPRTVIFILPALMLLLSFLLKTPKAQDILAVAAIGTSIISVLYLYFMDVIPSTFTIGFILWLIIYIFLRCYDFILKRKQGNEKISTGRYYLLVFVFILGFLMLPKFIVQILLIFYGRLGYHFDYLFIVEFIIFVINLFLLRNKPKIGYIGLIILCFYEILNKIFYTSWYIFHVGVMNDVIFLLILEPLLLGSIFFKLFSLFRKQKIELAAGFSTI